MTVALRFNPGRWLTLLAIGTATSGCATPYEGRYDFSDGWRKGEIVRIEPFEELAPRLAPRCSAGPSSQAVAGTTWAVVRYRLAGRNELVAVPVPPSESFTIAEKVYANVSACSRELRKRAAAE